MKKFIYLISFIFLFACEQKEGRKVSPDESFVENGVVKQYDDENRLSAEITFKNGVRHGLTRIYYSSGALSDEIMYVISFANDVYKGKSYKDLSSIPFSCVKIALSSLLSN